MLPISWDIKLNCNHNISLGLRVLVLFHLVLRIHELSSFMFVSDGRPILESMVLDYKAWAQYTSVISHGYKKPYSQSLIKPRRDIPII